MSFNYSPRIITDGLVLYLDAANKKSYPGSGTAWNDLTRNGNNGTLTNGPTFNSSNLGSIVFDGTNDYVSVSDNATLNNLNGSISIWFNNNGTYGVSGSGTSEIIGKHTAGGSFNGYGINITNTNVFAYVKNTSTNYFTFTGGNIVNNKWYNATITYTNNGNLLLYNNGILVGNRALGTLTTNSDPLRIGYANDPYWEPFNGNISLSMVYNRVLTNDEIIQNYNALKGRFDL